MPITPSRRVGAAVAALIVASLALAACSAEEAPSYVPPAQAESALPDDVVAELEDAVRHAMASTAASGAIVGVWVPWAGTWVTAEGTQAADSETPVTTDMVFRVGDVTRLMICDVLYALDARGVVSKDDAVAAYVSGVNDLDEVSLLDLCNSTGGIGSFEDTVRHLWLQNPERVWGPLELAAYGLGQSRTEPKTQFRNSDSGYLLLGLALERATGRTAADLIRQYVAEPLGLTQTGLPSPAPAPPGSPALQGNYLVNGEGGLACHAPVDITTLSSSIGYTDSGAVSTIEELGRYIQATASQALFGGEASERFAHPLPASDSTPSWRQSTGGAQIAEPLIGQFGTVPGYATAAFADPATGFTVAVVLNSSTYTATTAVHLAWELAAIASKAPAAAGESLPELALPFTAETYRAEIASRAVDCAPAPEA